MSAHSHIHTFVKRLSAAHHGRSTTSTTAVPHSAHHPDRPALARDPAPLEAREEPVLLLAVVAAVGKFAEEAGQLQQVLRVHRAALLGVAQAVQPGPQQRRGLFNGKLAQIPRRG